MNILLLQGPMGPFFSNLRKDLEKDGHTVYKINFNGGDVFFNQGDRNYKFRDHPDMWRDYLDMFLNMHSIHSIFAYGDCRYYHRIAFDLAKERGIKIFFYEEGYLRPNYITLEEDGVNANSQICEMTQIPSIDKAVEAPKPLGNDFFYRILYASLYYIASFLNKRQFPYYLHHRSFSPFYEGLCWVRALARKILYQIPDKILSKNIVSEYKDRFYFVPLQIKDDAQVTCHSNFSSVEDFILTVLSSFKSNGPKECALVFKHHPMDRGHTYYGRFIRRKVKELNIKQKVFYVHEAHNPSLFRACRGVVTINSTMGLSAIIHRKPIIALGRSVYNRKGLTYQGSLDNFWQEEKFESDDHLVENYLNYIKSTNQLNASFYRHLNNETLFKKKDLSLPFVGTEIESLGKII